MQESVKQHVRNKKMNKTYIVTNSKCHKENVHGPLRLYNEMT